MLLCLRRLELNSAGCWPSRSRTGQLWDLAFEESDERHFETWNSINKLHLLKIVSFTEFWKQKHFEAEYKTPLWCAILLYVCMVFLETWRICSGTMLTSAVVWWCPKIYYRFVQLKYICSAQHARRKFKPTINLVRFSLPAGLFM